MATKGVFHNQALMKIASYISCTLGIYNLVLKANYLALAHVTVIVTTLTYVTS